MRIMFVCHGNICRSPMAECIMRSLIADAGKSECISVSSSATSTEEIRGGRGNPIYPPAKATLRANGIAVPDREAVQLKKSDYEKYDLFLCMDQNNLRNTLRIFGADPLSKVKKLMDYTAQPRDVADPWYTGNFEITYRDILQGCTALLQEILSYEKDREF